MWPSSGNPHVQRLPGLDSGKQTNPPGSMWRLRSALAKENSGVGRLGLPIHTLLRVDFWEPRSE